MYGTNKVKVTNIEDLGKELSGSVGAIIGYNQNGKDKYHTFEMRDSIPKSVNLAFKGAAYFYIIAKDKSFPAFICSDQRNIQFSYYINFLYKEKPRARHPLGAANVLANIFGKDSSRRSTIVSFGAGNNTKEIDIRDVAKPNQAVCDLEL